MITYEDSVSITIDGVNINKFASDLEGRTTVEELEELEIFSHLSGGDATSAYEELLEASRFFFAFAVGEITVNHTNGVLSLQVGKQGSQTNSAIGAGLSGTPYQLDLTPDEATYWMQIGVPATAKSLLISSNVVADDCFADSNANANGIIAWYSSAFRDSSNSATSGTRATITFLKSGAHGDTQGVVTGGPTYAGNIGDNGTFYAKVNITAAGESTEIGTGGSYTGYYFIFAVQVAANVDTKNYKFRFELEYEA